MSIVIVFKCKYMNYDHKLFLKYFIKYDIKNYSYQLSYGNHMWGFYYVCIYIFLSTYVYIYYKFLFKNW